MRTMTYAALALAAGLAFSGAASADEYDNQMNREQYAVSAETTANQVLLPATAQATVRFAPQATTQTQTPRTPDPHWGPSMEGTPSRL